MKNGRVLIEIFLDKLKLLLTIKPYTTNRSHTPSLTKAAGAQNFLYKIKVRIWKADNIQSCKRIKKLRMPRFGRERKYKLFSFFVDGLLINFY